MASETWSYTPKKLTSDVATSTTTLYDSAASCGVPPTSTSGALSQGHHSHSENTRIATSTFVC